MITPIPNIPQTAPQGGQIVVAPVQMDVQTGSMQGSTSEQQSFDMQRQQQQQAVAIARRQERTQEENQAQLEEAVDAMRESASQSGADLNFRIDDDSGVTVVSVVARNNGEVLRQIPGDAALRIAKHLRDVQEQGGAPSGSFIAETA